MNAMAGLDRAGIVQTVFRALGRGRIVEAAG
jgi:1-deoxy-D-xylulose-5-phosphate synthase